MGRSTTVWRDARTLFAEGTVAGLTDGELLDRFAQRSAALSEVAFTALVARHGPMVLGVCRRILSSPHDVDDAFQATFLVLVRRAASVRVRDSLAPWLYGVSHRVATRARIAAARRRARETSDLGRPPARPDRAPEDRDLRSAIDDELARLPERYRSAVVLCYLQGLSHDEASRRLRCPVGTIKSRLARGRLQLRRGLIRRGLAPAAGSFASAVLARPCSAALPGELCRATVRAAVSHVMGRCAGPGTFPASATALTEGVLKAMAWTNLKWTAASLLVLCAVGSGSLALRSSRADDPRASSPVVEPRQPASRAEIDETRLDRLARPGKPPNVRRPIKQALDEPVTVNFDNAPLVDAMRYLADYCKVNIVLDPKGMADEGVTPMSRVNMVATDIKLRAALKFLLRPLGLEYRVVDPDEVIMISSFASGADRARKAEKASPALSVYVSLPTMEGVPGVEVLKLAERAVKEIERTSPFKLVASAEDADLIVTPTRRLLDRGAQRTPGLGSSPAEGR